MNKNELDHCREESEKYVKYMFCQFCGCGKAFYGSIKPAHKNRHVQNVNVDICLHLNKVFDGTIT